jgi:hypothetical protein
MEFGGAMEKKKCSEDEMARMVEQGEFILRECNAKRNTDEEDFWRGNMAGFRSAVESVYGIQVAHELLEKLRTKTNLGVPHSGPKVPGGGYLGTDLEADPEVEVDVDPQAN